MEELIKVPENEFKPLLDPDRVVADIRAHLTPWINLILLPILLRQVVAMLDGIEILSSNGAIHTALGSPDHVDYLPDLVVNFTLSLSGRYQEVGSQIPDFCVVDVFSFNGAVKSLIQPEGV